MKKKRSEKLTIDELSTFDEAQSTPQEDNSLSAEEISLLKESINSARVDRSKLPPHDQRGVAYMIRFIRSNTILSVASVIIAAAIVLSTIGGAFFLAMKLVNDMKHYTIVIGNDEPYKVAPDQMIINDVMYVDMRKIASYTGLTLSGSSTRIQFTSLKNGSYLLFENDSPNVYINGGLTEIKGVTIDGKKIVTCRAYVTKKKMLNLSHLVSCQL